MEIGHVPVYYKFTRRMIGKGILKQYLNTQYSIFMLIIFAANVNNCFVVTLRRLSMHSTLQFQMNFMHAWPGNNSLHYTTI